MTETEQNETPTTAAEEPKAPEAAPAAEERTSERRAEGDRPPAGARPQRGGDSEDERPRRRGRRRRVCIMCAEHMKSVDYKDVGFLKRYVSDRARIETRRKSSSCAKHQRAVARAIKRARHMALIPYTPEHIRVTGYSTRY